MKGKVNCFVLFENSVKLNLQVCPIYAYCLHFLSEERLLVQVLKKEILQNCLKDEEIIEMLQFFFENNIIDICKENEECYLIGLKDYSADKRIFDKSLLIFNPKPSSTNVLKSNEQILETLKYYSSYIKGFLSNIGPMNLKRLHVLLQKFIQGPMRFTYSIEELKILMDSLVCNAVVVLNEDSGEYTPGE